MSTPLPRLRVAQVDVRQPPHDRGAERAVLSALLLDPGRLREVQPVLGRDAWYDPRHQTIYRALLDLAASGEPIDVATVAHQVRDRGVPSEYLAVLCDATPAVAHLAGHARIVAECARRRRQLAAAQRMVAALRGGDTETAAEAHRALDDASRPVTRRGVSPTEIVEAWSESGPVVRVPTGIAPLDDLCRGGIAIPRRVMIVGAPSAGKTALAAVIAMSLAQHHVCVGILAVDEDPDDVTMRLAQMLGHAIADMERCDEVVLAAARASLSACRVRLYDATWSVEAAAADVASWARVEGMPAALVVDSVQTARADACATAPTAREHVEAVVAAIRDVSTQYSMLVIATSEANRASYRSDDAAREGNDLAAGAESRAIEYGAQTQLVLRTPRGHGDVIHVRVAKNRRADRGEFWLVLDRNRHALTECDDPDSCEAAPDPDPDGAQADALALAEVLAAYPDGLGVRELRREVRGAGHRWGHARLDAAVSLLVEAGRAEGTRRDGTRRGGPARIRLLPHDPLEDV